MAKKKVKQYKFKVKTRNNFGDKIFRGLGRLLKKHPEIINLNETDMPLKCIMIGNHNGAGGPFHYRSFLDKMFMTWGAHPMCEGFRSRWNYLYHTFYRKKLKFSKFKAAIVATLFGIISKWVYNFAGIIPIYYDMRVKNTYKYSFDCFEKNVSVMVFPENSEDGYLEEPQEFFTGFLTLSRLYYKMHNEDLPIYTLYYNRDPKQIIIGKPMYLQELLAQGHTEKEIGEIFRKYLISLRPQKIDAAGGSN